MTAAGDIGADAVPRFPRGVRLRFDRTRERWLVLAPETVLTPDETAVEVLRLVDGSRSVAVIASALAEAFDAPVEEIRADVAELVADLRRQGYLET